MTRDAIVSTILLAVVVVTVVSSLAAPGGAVSNGDTTFAQQATTQNGEALTVQDLTAGGQRPSGAPPSVRAGGTYEEYAVKFLPTGLWVDESEDSPHWQYLEPGTTVKRDTVQLWSKRGYGESSKNVVIRVAHFQTRTINDTRRAVNVSTYSIDATLGGGYSRVDVDFESHYQEQTKTVICVEQADEPNCLANPNGVRWRLNHETSPAMASTSISSEGDKIAWGLGYMLLPFFAASLSSMFGARKAIQRAKSSPRIPWWIWPVLLVGSLVGVFAAWDQIVATAVQAPWALSVVGGLVIGLVAAVWFGDDRKTSLMLRLRPDEWIDSPPTDDGGDAEVAADGGMDEAARPGRASSTLVADAIPVPMVHGANGERYHVADGFWNWIARARGALAQLTTKNDNQSLQTRIEVETGPYEELYLLDPEADDDEVIDHKSEGHRWEMPKILWKDEDGWHFEARSLLTGAFVFGTLSLAGKVLLASSTLGLLVGAVVLGVWKFATPDDGRLEVALANIHYQRALPFVIQHAKEISDAGTVDELFDRWTSAEIDSQIDRQELEDRRDVSRMDRLAERYLGHADAEGVENQTNDRKEAEADD